MCCVWQVSGSDVVDFVRWLKIMANSKTLVYQGRQWLTFLWELQQCACMKFLLSWGEVLLEKSLGHMFLLKFQQNALLCAHLTETQCCISTALVDRGKAIDVVYLGLCKALDTVLHDIFVSKLETWVWSQAHLQAGLRHDWQQTCGEGLKGVGWPETQHEPVV